MGGGVQPNPDTGTTVATDIALAALISVSSCVLGITETSSMGMGTEACNPLQIADDIEDLWL
jgi:hypothetical protein